MERPALVKQHQREEDDRDDRHDRQRVVARGGVVDGQVICGVRARDHHVRIQVDEDRADRRRDRDRRGGKGPSVVVGVRPRAAKITAITASTSTGWGTSAPPATLRVQITHPTTSAIAAQPSGPIAARTLAQLIGGAQLGNVAPCSRHSASSVTPVHRPYPVSRSKKLPVNSWLESSGRPPSRSPSPNPSSSGIKRLPSVVHHVNVVRQRSLSPLPLNSTPRRAPSTRRARSAARDTRREERRVPGREGGEHARAGDDQPDLVAIPPGADRVQRDAMLTVGVLAIRSCAACRRRSQIPRARRSLNEKIAMITNQMV